MRSVILFFVTGTNWFANLTRRASYLEIGVTGTVTEPDKVHAELHHLEPLSGFERWLLGDWIDGERAVRRENHRNVFIELAGYDPYAEC